MIKIKNKGKKGGLVKGGGTILTLGHSMVPKDVLKKYGKDIIQTLNENISSEKDKLICCKCEVEIEPLQIWQYVIAGKLIKPLCETCFQSLKNG